MCEFRIVEVLPRVVRWREKVFVYKVTSYTLSKLASIRVSDNLYRELNRVAGQLRAELGRPVSMEEVLEHLLKSRRLKPSDFAGAWEMSDEEVEEFKRSLRRFWSSWKYPRE